MIVPLPCMKSTLVLVFLVLSHHCECVMQTNEKSLVFKDEVGTNHLSWVCLGLYILFIEPWSYHKTTKRTTKMCQPVPNTDFSLLSKRKTLLSLNKSMGLDPFNTKALELLPAAISSEHKWDKWGETQQHHRFIHWRESRVEYRVGGKHTKD